MEPSISVIGLSFINLDEGFKSISFPEVKRLNWQVLPPGEIPWKKAKKYIEPVIGQTSIGKKPIINERIETIGNYGPDFIAIGKSGFNGYMIFGFTEKNLFVFESAFYGNATYVFEGSWEELSKLTKAQILANELQKDRIIHQKSWKEQLDKFF